MWIITNQTPFAAERGWVRDRDGAERWLVAVKGTFTILPDGTLELADEQVEPLLVPEFFGDPLESSLKYDTDFSRLKTATDVLLHGTAYAPKGEETPQVDVNLRVGNVDKTLRVFGDRTWSSSVMGTRLSRPKPFTEMALVYERAYGGADRTSANPNEHDWDRRNPAGVGFATRAEHLDGKPAPNVEDPHAVISDGKSRPNPMGYGPIPGHWLPRVNFTGTYDEEWEKTRQPLLPEDFDDRFYQAAPEDQQFDGFMKGGETVELTNLTPNGKLTFRIPEVRLGFRTVFQFNQTEHHRGVIHTVLIEPDVPRLIVVWHSSLRVHGREDLLLTTFVTMKQRLHKSPEPWELEQV